MRGDGSVPAPAGARREVVRMQRFRAWYAVAAPAQLASQAFAAYKPDARAAVLEFVRTVDAAGRSGGVSRSTGTSSGSGSGSGGGALAAALGVLVLAGGGALLWSRRQRRRRDTVQL